MTLEQIQEFHLLHHVGFIWQCPYCRDAWIKAKEMEKKQS
jgi:hypothetical protein